MTIIMFYGMTRAIVYFNLSIILYQNFYDFEFYHIVSYSNTIVTHLPIREAVLDTSDLNSEYFDELKLVLFFFFREICRSSNL